MDISVLTDPLSFVQSPPKGVTIPYRPKPSGSPVIFAGGQVHAILWRESVDARVWVFCVCVCEIFDYGFCYILGKPDL